MAALTMAEKAVEEPRKIRPYSSRHVSRGNNKAERIGLLTVMNAAERSSALTGTLKTR